MRYPYVESGGSYDFSLMYYGERREPAAGKLDIDSRAYEMSEVLFDVALMGGDPDDVVDTALLHASNCASRELRLSTAPAPIERAAQVVETDFTDEFVSRLVDRAEATMTGAALFGALRAIAYTISKTCPHTARSGITALALQRAREHGLVAGPACVIADDSHAHLFVSENMSEPEAEPMRSEILSLRQRLARQGWALLAASFATARSEPWNPFLQHRLLAEKAEHSSAERRVHLLDPQFPELVEEMAAGLTAVWADATAAWQAEQTAIRDDIGAYFWTRAEAPGIPRPDEVPQSVREAAELEPKITRLV